MFLHPTASHQRKLMFCLLLSSAGVLIWAGFGSSHRLPANTITVYAECSDAADVLAARDQSRNGVSLTCNNNRLRMGAVR